MLRGRLLLLASMSAFAVAAPAVAGKKVPSAEQGAVPLVVGAPLGLDAPVTVRSGQIAWRETFRPERNVRLLDAAVERKRPAAQPVPAGTVLFGYRLGSGVAYCPPGDVSRGVIAVQCFRDFNRDGRFEGGYVTEYTGTGSRYMAGSVHALGPAANMRYERIEAADAAPIDGGYRFVGFKGGMAQFRLLIDNIETDMPHACEPAADGACHVAGLTLKIEPQGEGARISLLAASPDRQIQINMYGLSLPGPGA
jgi:hypothetical protein